MQTMNVSLPDSMKDFVEHQIAQGRYGSASEYIRELIREDEKRRAQERLELLLLEGLAGEATEVSREDGSEIRNEALRVLKARSRNAG